MKLNYCFFFFSKILKCLWKLMKNRQYTLQDHGGMIYLDSYM